ncbi:hypothetical protein ETU08_09700 [Apibacter muscae]|uniref:hypothetical protein n=1 Tax=Apibacter muscae TaxID=2509004 RepID=UPI0011ADE7CE|nr:hypothetical protein [Apibacter muscae]TWP27981.1 hypothetical protein ETU08_09700 [Apibacter muscae]
MKQILFMSILSLLLSIMGCNRENQYLKDHKVILCYELNKKKLTKEAKDFSNNSILGIEEAGNIYKEFLVNKKELDSSKSNLNLSIHPKIIIDSNYVFSFYNMKQMKIAVFGIWINANTGKITYNKDELWLNEREIGV